MPTPNLFVGHVAGDTLPAADWDTNWALVESSLLALGPFVISGLVPSAGTGLAVAVTAGSALLGALVVIASGFNITGLTASATNFLYLQQNGTGTANTTGIAPANSVLLGTAVTGVGTVTSVDVLHSSGRQLWVYPTLRVPGAPGGPGSISLAAWAAAAGDGVQLFGVLPAAGLPADVAYVDVTNTFTQPQVITALAAGRCLTLNADTGATIFIQPKTGTLFSNFRVPGAFQWGTDPSQTNTVLWQLQNLVTGSGVIQANATDLVTLGSAGATAGVAVNGHLSAVTAAAPTAAAGANAGTSPPAPVVTAGDNDVRGTLTFGSGTGPAAGAQVVVTFAHTYGAAPYVILTANNAVTAALSLYVTAISATQFTIAAANAPAGSQANTVYSLTFMVMG